MEMMHGWVRAESDPGKGTRVSFGFYQKQVPTEISEPGNIGREILKEQNDPQVEEIQPNWIYPRARVLLVDDMEANRVDFSGTCGSMEVYTGSGGVRRRSCTDGKRTGIPDDHSGSDDAGNVRI